MTKVIGLDASPDSIFSLVKNKDQWRRWHPSFLNGEHNEMLSKIRVNIKSQTDSLLLMQWEQKGKKSLDMGWQLFKEPNTKFATLQWYIDFHLSWYPWEKIGRLFY